MSPHASFQISICFFLSLNWLNIFGLSFNFESRQGTTTYFLDVFVKCYLLFEGNLVRYKFYYCFFVYFLYNSSIGLFYYLFCLLLTVFHLNKLILVNFYGSESSCISSFYKIHRRLDAGFFKTNLLWFFANEENILHIM